MAGILLTLLIIALIGFVVYLITSFIPMAEPFKQLIIVACVVLVVLYLIAMLSGAAALPTLTFPR